MEVTLRPEHAAFVRDAIADGRIAREEDAVQEALDLWTERQRRRAEILEAVERADASLAAGKGIPLTEDSAREMAERVKRRGRQWMEANAEKADELASNSA
jgi:Arc/MetJ-type ribon-helix-helix transcriptional regulator